MTETTRMYWLHALTPLHVGAGRGVGFIDLPIVREKVTAWPLVPGSAVKGVLADHFVATVEARSKDDAAGTILKAAFGISGDEHSNAGSLVFTDARLVCMPVRSLYGTFAWVTSPLALRRVQRDLDMAGVTPALEIPEVIDADTLQLPQGIHSTLRGSENCVYFEDLDFTSQETSLTRVWAERIAEWTFPHDAAWQTEFRKRFAVIPDGSFDFLCETGTEVNARVRIEPEKKTVASGALWYEECLPAEAILAGLVWCDRIFPQHSSTPEKLLGKFCSRELKLQIGGKATVGKGQVRCLFSNRGTAHE